MKRLVLPLCVGAFLALALGIIWNAAIAQEKPADKDPPGAAVQRYIPDDRPWQPAPRPRPDAQRVIYAETIILDGPSCTITLSATQQQPGVILEHKRSGERALVYFTPEGRAVVGVATPARKEIAAGVFTEAHAGSVQMADRWGVHVFTGEDLSRGCGIKR